MAERKKPKADTEATRPANDSVGATLKAARLARGIEVDVVSQTIHIRPSQLKAIEANDIESLPGMTYAVGFVRSYANFLGLNGAEIVHRFKAEHGHTAAQSKLSFPEPVTESRVPDPMMIGVGLFLAVVILVLWTVYSNVHGGSKTADKIPPAPVVTSVADAIPPATATTPALSTAGSTPESPAVAAAPVVAPATEEATTVQPAPAASPVVTAPPADQPKPAQATPAPAKEAAASDDSESEDAADAADDEAAPAAKAQKAGKDNDQDSVIKIKHGKSRITLKATAASWVQVTDGQQNVLYRKVLRPGEQYSVPDQPGLRLDTANAGGLEIVVDGKQVQSVGKNGEIIRGIALDPKELSIKRMQARDRDQ